MWGVMVNKICRIIILVSCVFLIMLKFYSDFLVNKLTTFLYPIIVIPIKIVCVALIFFSIIYLKKRNKNIKKEAILILFFIFLRIMICNYFLYYFDYLINNNERKELCSVALEHSKSDNLEFNNSLMLTNESVFLVKDGDLFGIFFCKYKGFDEMTGLLYISKETSDKFCDYNIKIKCKYSSKCYYVICE